MAEQTLLHQFDTFDNLGYIQYDPKAYVVENLNTAIDLRPYQVRAIARSEYYLEKYPKKKTPVHLLFHMAAVKPCSWQLIFCISIIKATAILSFLSIPPTSLKRPKLIF